MSKIKKIRAGNFTQISNIVFDDYRLSYKEIGLYCNMMRFPDDWEFTIRYLTDLHADKKAAVTTGLEKLIELGYIVRAGEQPRNKKGLYGTYDYIIYEDPTDNPGFIPFGQVKKATVSENQTAVTESNEGTVSDFQTPLEETVSDFQIPIVGTVSDYRTPSEATVSDFRYTDNPSTDFRYTDNQLTTNTIYTNTVLTNTFLPNIEEEEDMRRTRVDVDLFKKKITNSYMNAFFNTSNERTQRELQQTYNALVNAVGDIDDPLAVEAIDNCPREKVDELFKWTYRNLFSTTLGAVIRDDINDIRSYLVKVISRNATADYGPNPLNDWRRI